MPSAPAPQVRVLHARWFSLDAPFRADSLDAAHAPPRSERARPSRRRARGLSGRVLETVGSGVQRVRVHGSLSSTRSIPRWRSPWAAVTRARSATMSGEVRSRRRRATRRCLGSAGDRRRARDCPSWRHATADLRPAPARPRVRVRAFGDERALALASPLPSLTPAVVLPSPSHSPRTRRSTVPDRSAVGADAEREDKLAGAHQLRTTKTSGSGEGV